MAGARKKFFSSSLGINEYKRKKKVPGQLLLFPPPSPFKKPLPSATRLVEWGFLLFGEGRGEKVLGAVMGGGVDGGGEGSKGTQEEEERRPRV